MAIGDRKTIYMPYQEVVDLIKNKVASPTDKPISVERAEDGVGFKVTVEEKSWACPRCGEGLLHCQCY